MRKIFRTSLVFIMTIVASTLFAQNNEGDSNGTVFSSSQIIPPKYNGGEQEMYRFIDSVLVVPQSAIDNGVSGRVIVRFFVDKEGNIKSPNIQQGLTPECNQAAIEAVKKMPLWLPATQNGKAVTGFAIVPVSFKVQKVTYDYEPTQAELTYEQYVLPNKKWKLIKLNNKDLPDNLPNQPYFVMSVNKRRRRVVEGNASCAKFSARYNWNLKRWRLTFSKIEKKKKKCKSKKVTVIDSQVLNVLKKTKEFRITKEGYLEIGRKEKNRFVSFATFESEPLKK
ncbi:MAG: hypothetical protein CSA89_01225 [Bacteroidales bacterium]|nr:MAG: hypothetical protein CSA89_01225 [Bacteroidales bacterium]